MSEGWEASGTGWAAPYSCRPSSRKSTFAFYTLLFQASLYLLHASALVKGRRLKTCHLFWHSFQSPLSVFMATVFFWASISLLLGPFQESYNWPFSLYSACYPPHPPRCHCNDRSRIKLEVQAWVICMAIERAEHSDVKAGNGFISFPSLP